MTVTASNPNEQLVLDFFEVLLQVGIYGGIPAAVDSFRIANEAFAEFEAEEADGA